MRMMTDTPILTLTLWYNSCHRSQYSHVDSKDLRETNPAVALCKTCLSSGSICYGVELCNLTTIDYHNTRIDAKDKSFMCLR